jgi:hypothetical protein
MAGTENGQQPKTYHAQQYVAADMNGMNKETLEYLHTLHFITREQKERIERLSSHEVFSLHDELRWVMWTGAGLFIAGITTFAYNTINTTGQSMLIALLFVLSGTALLSTKRSNTSAPSVNPSSVPIMLGCVLFAAALGYWQYAYAPFGSEWQYVGLTCGAVFVPLAYKYDHRGALALAFVGIGVAIGLTVSPLSLMMQGYIVRTELISVGFAYGGLLAVIGACQQYLNIKKHFTNTFMLGAGHCMFLAALAGLVTDEEKLPFFLILLLLCYAGTAYARRARSFSALVSASLYGYLGVAYVMSKAIDDPSLQTSYIIVSCAAVVVGLLSFRKSFMES